jgi:hypothetical protein
MVVTCMVNGIVRTDRQGKRWDESFFGMCIHDR